MTLTIAIDPGHGGGNWGTAHGHLHDRLVEKAWTIEIAHMLVEACSALPVDLPLIRRHDEDLSLADRGLISKAVDADFVLSIHVNAHGDENMRGMLSFHMPNPRASRMVSLAIVEAAPAPLRRATAKTHEAEEGGWTRNVHNVLSPHAAPSCLVECFFASNEQDRKYAMSEWGKHGIVNALRAGVIEAGRLLG